MKIRVALLLVLLLPFSSHAQEFVEKPINKFPTLADFSSVSEFENNINEYVQECLYNSGGGSLVRRCFVSYELWDRELNHYYQLLYKSSDESTKKLLIMSQRSWLKSRDDTIQFNSHLLDDKYNKQGTMYLAMRADEVNTIISPIIKNRALLLKMWFELKGNH
ncbi:hypothetical protein A6E05_19200 [Aliivibrio sp. 1S165]|nr:hypothetical protein A6E05_19200 [Aliivibrio sp. 1S165]OCH34001.1 hypothetical protein A6E06_16895 [Aliivibrio sp. 1S175]